MCVLGDDCGDGSTIKIMNLPILGATLSECNRRGDESIEFITTDGRKYVMQHHEDCCECVTIDDICGELSDLVGTPILQAEEASNMDAPACSAESYTWTFYRIATIKGAVCIRWLGTSNGYYSESVNFDLVEGLEAK